MYSIVVKPEAEQEIREGLAWCENQKQGLGAELFKEILEVMARIKSNPEHIQKRYKDFRIAFTKRFRYGIHFTVEDKVVYVHAVWHTSKKPRD